MIEDLEVILREAGDLLLEWRAQGIVHGHWEGSQLKAEADLRAHDFLLKKLHNSWPGIPVISEEDVSKHEAYRPEEYWLVDPIDGTASFCNGFDGFVTQAALMRNYQPVLAVVHAPALKLTYTATLNGAAYCNNSQILTVESGIRAPILIDNYPEPRGIALEVYKAFGCSEYIESGSLGLKICRVADGTVDLFVKDVIVRDWDLAPAHLVLACAGGQITTLPGKNLSYDGGFEREGVVAAGNQELMDRVSKWNERRTDIS